MSVDPHTAVKMSPTAQSMIDRMDQRIEWRQRTVRQILGYVSQENQETVVQLLFTALDQSFNEGTLEGAELLNDINRVATNPTVKHYAANFRDSIKELHNVNSQTQKETFDRFVKNLASDRQR